ncbi:hypothetical protein C8J57DRAFT_1519469 [Mycena rebaudengoi]|nr:hypothetical protein C8J57DRAFT_1519469 [Mycena rebaudengoi]
MEDLAQELIDKIVEYVSTCDDEHEPYCSGTWWWNTDRRNLKVCALVSPQFLASNQRCLFRSLAVRPNSNATRGLPQTPHLAAYVRNLRIKAYAGVNPTLARILPLFGGVTHLVVDANQVVEANQRFRPHLHWTIFPPLLRLPNLLCLGLLHCSGVPTSFIHSALSSFREVALINVDLHEDNCPVTYSDTFRSHKTLDRLILDCSPRKDTVLAALMRCKDSLPDIEHLELFAHKQDLLGGCEVACLNIQGHGFCDTMTALPTRMPNIENLIIVLDAPFGPKFYRQLRRSVADALSHLPHLREVHIRVSVEHYDLEEDDDDELPFDTYIRESRSIAQEAGRVTFSKRCWCRQIHPMALFSNQVY